MAENLYTHQDENVRRTWLLMTVFLVFVIAIGFLFSYVRNQPAILYGAVIFSVLMNITAYWFSDKLVLSSAHAKFVTREENVRLYRIIENLCITAGLPLPRIHVIPGMQINAFATGRNPKHAALAFTVGALEKLDDNELTGVAAHELSHIGNRDILVSTVAVVLAGVIAILADLFLRIGGLGRSNNDDNRGNALAVLAVIAAILAPIAATLIRLAISRKREYLADASGALLTRYPEGLASALEKIMQDTAPLRFASTATEHLYISNPFKKEGWLGGLFHTHPPLQDRIRLLRGQTE